MESYHLSLENSRGELFSFYGKVMESISFPKLPLGGERIFLKDSPELFEYFKMRASPWEELQKRFSNRTYKIEEINFGDVTVIKAKEID